MKEELRSLTCNEKVQSPGDWGPLWYADEDEEEED